MDYVLSILNMIVIFSLLSFLLVSGISHENVEDNNKASAPEEKKSNIRKKSKKMHKYIKENKWMLAGLAIYILGIALNFIFAHFIDSLWPHVIATMIMIAGPTLIFISTKTDIACHPRVALKTTKNSKNF